MKLPRYSLRTLFVFCTLAGIACAWITYQLNWIRQRHGFLDAHNNARQAARHTSPNVNAPFPLRLFAEPPHRILVVPANYTEKAKRLFPEARVFAPEPPPTPEHDTMF
jgi:hypothetical protein